MTGAVVVQRKFCEGAAWANADMLEASWLRSRRQVGCADVVVKVKNQKGVGLI